jgi:S1-C subfamily serine protease
LRVFDVAPNSVAYEMGVLRRDVIVAINGMKVDSGMANDARKFLTALNNLGKGAAIVLDILREDKLGLIYIRRNAVLGEPKTLF